MSETTQAPKQALTLSSGAKVAGIVPSNMDEVRHLATIAVRGGIMGWYRDEEQAKQKTSQGMLIIMQGLELGLTPMQAFNGITVINGRTGVWGKLARSLVLRAGHKIEERVEHAGDPEKATHYCRITRKDGSMSKEVSFSVADAKRAALWDDKAIVKRRGKTGVMEDMPNDGVWFRYWPRMLTHRAFGYAANDVCPEALLGMSLAEDLQDLPAEDRGHIVEPTPPPLAPPPPPAFDDEIPMLSEEDAGTQLPEGRAEMVAAQPAPDMFAAFGRLEAQLDSAETADEAVALFDAFMAENDGFITADMEQRLDALDKHHVARIGKLNEPRDDNAPKQSRPRKG